MQKALKFIGPGMGLSLCYMLLGDWLAVNEILPNIGDEFVWIIFCILLLPLLFMGFYSRKNKIISSIFYTLIVGLSWTIICVFILLHFHFLIGGTK